METNSSTGIDYGIRENKQARYGLTIYYHPSVSKERFLSPLGYAFRDTSLAIASI